MTDSGLASAKRMTGTTSPSSTATAMPMWMWSYWRMVSPSQLALTSGCWRSAMAEALMMMSLKEILSGAISLTRRRSSIVRVISIFIVR